jgi:regulator of sigma E protease
LLFEAIIFVHEFGHFISAKRSGVKVNEFSLGMGPKLFSFTKGETVYSLRALPIGGFCAMEGEDEDSQNPRAFNNAKLWKRMIIIVAGALLNILLGFIFMLIIEVQQPYFVQPVVDSFPEQSYSAFTGLKEGDKIVRINNYGVTTMRDFQYGLATIKVSDNLDGKNIVFYKKDAINNLVDHITVDIRDKYKDAEQSVLEAKFNDAVAVLNSYLPALRSAKTVAEVESIYSKCYNDMDHKYGEYTLPALATQSTRQSFKTNVTVERNGQIVELYDVNFLGYKESEEAQPMVQLDFYTTAQEKNFGTVLSNTFNDTISVVKMVWASLIGLVTGQFGLTDVAGPVGMTSAIQQVTSEGLEVGGFAEGFNRLFFMMMLITVNLGVFNLLPFPALDGGRFVFLAIEAIARKPIPRKIEAAVNGAGLAILMLFILVVTLKDVWQLVANIFI